MDKSENFIEKYKHLEDVVRMTYNLREADSISYYLTNQAKYARFADELRYCQKVRNFLVHEKKVNDNFAVEVSKSMLDFIDSLIDSIVNQPRCSDVQIKFRDIYWRSINDTVNETMSVMRDKLFTHVPILDDECTVIGVFDENAMFTYIAEEGIVSIDEELRFSDIQKHLSIANREMEAFVFVRPNTYVEELESIIEDAFKNGKRVGLAFVTVSGKSSDRLQGIITPWDIIKVSKND